MYVAHCAQRHLHDAGLAHRSATQGVRGRERMVSFKGAHFERDIILACVRWYLAYPLS